VGDRALISGRRVIATMATLARTKKKYQRERGTLKDTLPRRPIFLVALVCAASATLANLLFLHTSHVSTSSERRPPYFTWVSGLLGAVSASVGIICGDSLPHVFAFGVTRLFIGHGDIKSSIVVTSPLFIFSALASMKRTRSLISSMDSSFLAHPFILRVCCLLPFLAGAGHTGRRSEYLNISAIPSCFVAFTTLLLMLVYNKNRAHKNGNLLSSEMKSQAIFAGISIVLSCYMTEIQLNPSLDFLYAFLMGSLFVLLMSLVFAFVADHWYAVGSGQFQMVSLDTAGMFVYVIAPVVILYLRFFEKYGKPFSLKYTSMEQYLQPAGILPKEDIISFSLVMMLAIINSVGIPLLNALCPIGGYLFSRAYTHGQPNTKKVALCIDFSDLQISRVSGMTDVWTCLEKKMDDQANVLLNIMVTLEELTQHPAEMKLIAEKGHAISLVPTDFQETRISLVHTRSISNLQIAHDKYPEIQWILAKDAIGRHPSLLSKASDLGIKVVYWSTLVQLSETKLTTKQKDAISADCSDKNGGSIIRVTLDKGVSSNTMISSLSDLINLLHNFHLDSFSAVVKDDLSHIIERKLC